MSANYFTDSLINNKPQEVVKANAHFTDTCSSPFLSAECSHLSSCSFASKKTIFPSWDPIRSQKSFFYTKHSSIAAGSGFLQPWIEPAMSSKNCELRSDDFSDMKYKKYKQSTPTKTQQINSSSRNAGRTKEDKYGLDSCKLLVLHLLKLNEQSRVKLHSLTR